MEGIEGFEKWIINCIDYTLKKAGFYGIIHESWCVSTDSRYQLLSEKHARTHIDIGFDILFPPLGTYGPAVHDFTMTDIDKIAECYGDS